MRSPQPESPSRFFFFNDPATTQIYTLSLHDALPIYFRRTEPPAFHQPGLDRRFLKLFLEIPQHLGRRDRKSTRLNSSHVEISYAVFCLKKKNNRSRPRTTSSRSHSRRPAAATPHAFS